MPFTAPEESLPLEEAANLIEKRLGLVALWLFGSRAAGRAQPESDVDLGVLFSRAPSLPEIIELQADLSQLFRRKVDLVDLKSASPIVARQVVSTGRLVSEPDRSARLRFVVELVTRYDDFLRVTKEVERGIRSRLQGAGSTRG